MVVLRRRRRSPLHAGAAWRRRDGLLLQGQHGRAGVAASRSDPILGIEWRRRSARDADTQQGSRLHVWGDWKTERARRAHRRPRVVAQRGDRQQHEGPDVGLRELASDRGRPRGRRRLWQARRLRPLNRQPSLDPPDPRRKLQLTTSIEHRRRRSDPALECRRRDQRDTVERGGAVGIPLGGRRDDRAARRHGRRRPSGQHGGLLREASARAASAWRTEPTDGAFRSGGRRSG